VAVWTLYGPLLRGEEVDCVRGARDVGQVGEVWVVPKAGAGMGLTQCLQPGCQ
jgi:hypothetical protein